MPEKGTLPNVFIQILKCPTETECRFAVGFERKFVLLVGFCAFKIFFVVAVVVSAGGGGVPSGAALGVESDAEFSADIQAFVNIEIYAGENVDFENIGGTF